MKSKYCKWYCMEYLEPNKWLFESSCGKSVEAKRGSSFYRALYADDDVHTCPNCGKIMTVGAQMD